MIRKYYDGEATYSGGGSSNQAKKYPIGGYAPGNYSCKCANCKTAFMGDKMAVQCEPCAEKMIAHQSSNQEQEEAIEEWIEAFIGRHYGTVSEKHLVKMTALALYDKLKGTEPVLRWVNASERSPNSPGWYHTNIGRIEWNCGNEDEYFWLNRLGGHVNEWLESIPSSLPDGEVKYFFSQDNDSHWYMIPVEKRIRWDQLINHLPEVEGWDEYDYDDAINDEFSQYATGGGIGDIEFTIN